jgi:hypothetical protein
MSLVNILNFLCTSYWLFPQVVNTYWTQVWAHCVYIPIAKMCYFYSCVLGIVILLDRIAIFSKSVKNLIKLSPAMISFISFAVCFFVDFPYFLVYQPGSKEVKLDATTRFTIWYLGTTTFAQSQAGSLLTFTVATLRDIVVMVILIVLNILSVYLLRKHFNKKKVVMGAGPSAGSSAGPSSNSINQRGVEAPSHRFSFMPDTMSKQPSESMIAVKSGRAGNEVSKCERKATVMVMLMCGMSIASHVSILTATVYSLFYLNLMLTYLSILCNFILVLSCFADFFFFYFFNKNFKKACHKYLRLSS